MTDSSQTRFIALCVALVSLATPGLALEARLSAPGAPSEMRRALSDAALSLQVAARADASAQEVLATARADYARLIGVLYERGYFGPVIHIRLDGREAATLAPLALGGAPDRLEITVQPGPSFTFGRASIAPLAPGTRPPDGYAMGQPAKTGVIRKAAQAGVEGWRAVGHAKADLGAQALSADHTRQRLDADLALVPGPAVRFGQLVITGPSAVRPDRLRAIVGLPQGARFDPDVLADSAERLRRTGAFRAVRLTEAETLGPGDTMDVGLTVSDAKPRRLGAGAELSSLEGLALSSYWMHRNLLGGAERLRFDAEVAGIGGSESGGVDYRLAARFDRPAVIRPQTGLYLQAELENLDEPDYREETGTIGGGLTYVFSDRLTGEIGIGLRYSDVTDALGKRSMTHALLPARLTWDGRDDVLDPSAGIYLDGELMPMGALGGAAESGVRLTADARAYRALGDRLVLAGRLQLGAVTGASATGVPPDLLFYSGGGGTVRGQPYESLAVDLGGGDQIGGRAFAGLSAEARVALTGPFGVVAFADAGFIADKLGGSGDWHSGAGLGLRYDTGFGPIRLDVAAPVGGDTGDGVQIYIGIGQAF